MTLVTGDALPPDIRVRNGLPVSAVIAELVMEHIETVALEISPVKPCWWRRYVDDSNACIQTDELETFHAHQFTVERQFANNGKSSIPSLDTYLTVSLSRHS